MAAGLGLGLLLAGGAVAASLRGTVDWRTGLDEVGRLEGQALAAQRAAFEAAGKGASDADTADRLDREVRPAWQEARRLADRMVLPRRLNGTLGRLREYLAAREDSTAALVTAFRANDLPAAQRAVEQVAAADRLATALAAEWQAANK